MRKVRIVHYNLMFEALNRTHSPRSNRLAISLQRREGRTPEKER